MYMRWRLNRPEKVPKAVGAPKAIKRASAATDDPVNPIQKSIKSNSWVVFRPSEKTRRERWQREKKSQHEREEECEEEYEEQDEYVEYGEEYGEEYREEYGEEYGKEYRDAYGEEEYRQTHEQQQLAYQAEYGANARPQSLHLPSKSTSPRRKRLRIIESSPELSGDDSVYTLSEAEEQPVLDQETFQSSYAQLTQERIKSQKKLQSAWENIIAKYGDPSLAEEGDVIDLVTGEVVEDRGHLQAIQEQYDNIWVGVDDMSHKLPLKKAKEKAGSTGQGKEFKFKHYNGILNRSLPAWSVLTSAKSPLRFVNQQHREPHLHGKFHAEPLKDQLREQPPREPQRDPQRELRTQDQTDPFTEPQTEEEPQRRLQRELQPEPQRKLQREPLTEPQRESQRVSRIESHRELQRELLREEQKRKEQEREPHREDHREDYREQGKHFHNTGRRSSTAARNGLREPGETVFTSSKGPRPKCSLNSVVPDLPLQPVIPAVFRPSASPSGRFKKSVPVKVPLFKLSTDDLHEKSAEDPIHIKRNSTESTPITSSRIPLDNKVSTQLRSTVSDPFIEFPQTDIDIPARPQECGDPGYNCRRPFCFTCS